MSNRESAELHVVLGSDPAGSTLAAELVGRGHVVRLVDRRGKGLEKEGIERHAADLSDAEQAREAVSGAEVVYHCVNVPYELQVRVMPKIQEAILSAVEAEGVRLVVLDTLYPYGETSGLVMTEDSPWAATSMKGRMRARLDERYLAAHREGRAGGVVLGRSADFYGPGVLNSSLGGVVFPGALSGGEVMALGDIDLLHSYTLIEDVAKGLATLGEHPEGDGRVWHLPTAEVTTRDSTVRSAGTVTGWPPSSRTRPEPTPEAGARSLLATARPLLPDPHKEGERSWRGLLPRQ